MAGRGIESMNPTTHADDVACLLGEVGADPAHVHDSDALSRDRREAAKRIIVWCPSPERLARWCIVAASRSRVRNVAGYLRRAAERGDPGTLLASSWQGEGVLPRVVEESLRGGHARDVARLVAGGTALRDAHVTGGERVRLRAELRSLLARGRTEGARRVLLRLVGTDRSDVALARAIEGICTLTEARGLVA